MSTIVNAQTAALEIAFVELAKFLGVNNGVKVTQLKAALESAAKSSAVNEETKAAVSALANRLY